MAPYSDGVRRIGPSAVARARYSHYPESDQHDASQCSRRGGARDLRLRSCGLAVGVVCVCVKSYSRPAPSDRPFPHRAAPSGLGRRQANVGRRRMGWLARRFNQGSDVDGALSEIPCPCPHAGTAVLAQPSFWRRLCLLCRAHRVYRRGSFRMSMAPDSEVGLCACGGQASAPMGESRCVCVCM